LEGSDITTADVPIGPLTGLKVLDACQLFAGPIVSTMLADFGADVIKVEHPKGDSLRTTGYQKDGKGLWWKVVNRNKRCVTLDLGESRGAELFKQLAADADVVLEGFRPGTMERWGLGWDVLHELNPRLVMVRMSGFGQNGPYASRPGFGTLAEAMSGFAHLVGQPDGPPSLPPFGLGDGIAAMVGAWATLLALYSRDVRGGDGQIVDVSLYEGLMFVVGPQVTYYDQLGIVDTRTGNRTPLNAPRNLYETREGKWVAIAATGLNTPRRMMELVGHSEIAEEPWFASARGRAEHVELIDGVITPWIRARTRDEVVKACEAIGAAVAPVYDASDLSGDPHVRERTISAVADPDFGNIEMQGVLARLSATPGSIRWTGPEKGAHNNEVYCEALGLTGQELADLAEEGIV
jgi:crotonobetainyl-CoA:carnitine CoA-transferase CaiB-like acyl-CoA transferase